MSNEVVTPTAYIKTLTENTAQIFPRTKYAAVWNNEGTENLTTKLETIDTQLDNHKVVIDAMNTISRVDTEKENGRTKVIINYITKDNNFPIPPTEILVEDGANFKIDEPLDKNYPDATTASEIAAAMDADPDLQSLAIGSTVSCMDLIFQKKLEGPYAVWKYLGPIGAVGVKDIKLEANEITGKQHLKIATTENGEYDDYGRIEGAGVENISLIMDNGFYALQTKIENQDAEIIGRVQGIGIQEIGINDNKGLAFTYDDSSATIVNTKRIIPSFVIDSDTKHLIASYPNGEDEEPTVPDIDLGNVLTDLDVIKNDETTFSIRSIQTVESNTTPLSTIQFKVGQGISFDLMQENDESIIQLTSLFGSTVDRSLPMYDHANKVYNYSGVYNGGTALRPQLVIGAGAEGYPVDKVPEGILTCMYYTNPDNGEAGTVRTLLNFRKRSDYNGQLVVGNNGVSHDDELADGPLQLYWYLDNQYYATLTTDVYKDINNKLRCNLSVNGTLTQQAADYAECFEWNDQNINNEDRRGLFVTFADDGETIRLANDYDTYILGIVSNQPGVLGNANPFEWKGKYITNAFGDRLLDEETGVPLLNPEYDETQHYIPRSKRIEWAQIGLMGQLIVCDDGTCLAGKYCTCGQDGVATAADTGWRVMKRIDENHIKILFK